MHGARGRTLFGVGALALAGVLAAGCDGSSRRGWPAAAGPAQAISGDLALCAWSDETSGSRRILVSRSTDGGATWSEPLAAGSTTGRSTPRLAAAGKTVLLVHGATGTNGLFLRRSSDGGETFGEAVTLDAQARVGAVDLRDGHALIGYATGSPTKVHARYGAFAP
ncbi:MAG: glycoside hydrolase [Planctomycetes bacterium]|nr:glycoside hydrolase [Planctomycetota bacterium]